MEEPLKKYAAESGEGSGRGERDEEDYLSKLANSILSGGSGPPPQRPGQGPPPAARDSRGQGAPLPSGGRPGPASGSRNPLPTQGAEAQLPRRDGRSEWVREVPMRGEDGGFLPGTILVLEDGTLAVYREYVPAKEYDLVYQLNENGRAVPQGLPLHNYDVEPIGRVSLLVLDRLSRENRWDRDMIVFHLLQYKDVAHVPRMMEAGSRGAGSSTIVPKLSEADLNPTATPPLPEERPQMTRGRRMTIDFGPGRTWEAVYWGKDELGHVVAHHTHERWALMHLDLNRFKESVTWGDILAPDALAKMEKDFAQG